MSTTSGAAQETTARPLTDPGRADGLTDQVAAVAAAREQLGRDIDWLNTEVRAQMGQTVEKLAWKLAATGAAVVTGIAVKKSLEAVWRKAAGEDPPANVAAPGVGWGQAVTWTAATGVGAAVAKLVAMRGAAAGWQKATGHLPPGLEETSL